MLWNIKFIKYTENKLTVTRYVQNVHHWHEHKHATMLAIGQLSSVGLCSKPHHTCSRGCRSSWMSWTWQWRYIFVTCKIDEQIAYLRRVFIAISTYVKIIKIHQDFPELWSQMYCHVAFMKHSVVVSDPLRPLLLLWAMKTVCRIRGKLLELFCAVLCTTVVHNDTHTRVLFLKLGVGLGLGLVVGCLFF